MADYWIILIPENPLFIPESKHVSQAEIKFREIAPKSDEIKSILTDQVVFYDCGSNFERILCPNCKTEIATHWWHEKLEEDKDLKTGFKLNPYQVPCCGAPLTLQQLIYEWTMGFGRFALQGRNCSIGRLEDKDKQILENILGIKMRVIYLRL